MTLPQVTRGRPFDSSCDAPWVVRSNERRDQVQLGVMQRWEEMMRRLQIEEEEGRAAQHAAGRTPPLCSS